MDPLLALARRHPEWWHDASTDAAADGTVDDLTLEPLGRGESFAAHLLLRGERESGEGPHELVLRVPHKDLAELPQSLREEHAMLARVPDGLAAAPIAVGEEDGIAYAVTTRVPGRVLPSAVWADEALLAALAHTLARLHHAGDRTGLPVPERIDPVGGAESALGWWRTHEPAAAQVLAPLWPAVRRHQERAAPAFRDVDPVLLHGDPAAANLLVDDAGEVRLVDWEWAQVGDLARDLAFIGGPITAEPWYAPLSEAQVEGQVLAYLEARALLGRTRPEDPSAVLLRRRAHLVHEAFFTAAHLHRTGERERSEELLEQVAAAVS